MCAECGMIPCHPCCPNAPEPLIFAHCCDCGDEIYEGEDYFDFDGMPFCEVCVMGKKRIAELEDFDDDER